MKYLMLAFLSVSFIGCGDNRTDADIENNSIAAYDFELVNQYAVQIDGHCLLIDGLTEKSIGDTNYFGHAFIRPCDYNNIGPFDNDICDVSIIVRETGLKNNFYIELKSLTANLAPSEEELRCKPIIEGNFWLNLTGTGYNYGTITKS